MFSVIWKKGKKDNVVRFDTKDQALAFRSGLKAGGVKGKIKKDPPKDSLVAKKALVKKATKAKLVKKK